MRAFLPILVGLMVVAIDLPTAAAADAKVIFKEGVDAMMAGDFDTGCPKIEEAYRLTEGAGALFTLAECFAKWDKPVAAVKHYRGYLKMYAKMPADQRKQQNERADLATTQVSALTALIPKLTIVLSDDQAEGASLTIDGEPVADGFNVAMPLEVGPHTVVVTGQDGATATHEVTLTEGVQRQWQVKLSAVPSPAPLPAPDGPDESGWSGVAIAGFVVGGVGLAALGVGAVTGGLAISQRGTADDHCVDRVCDQEGLDAVDQGKLFGDLSTATLVIGGVGVAAGLLMVLLGGTETEETVQLTPSGVRWAF